jgi:hypothetical protein
MRSWPAVLILFALACGQTGQPVGAKSSASPVAVASPSPIPGDLPLSRLSFSCRLPIVIPPPADGHVHPSTNAFLAFPSTSVTIDPTGNGGFSFDRAFSRWLPVGREAVSPDGTHYAFGDLGQQQDQFVIHVVDVASGQDRTFPINTGAAGFSVQPVVFDYSAEGIYLAQAFEGPVPGLWLFDPATGSIRQVTKVSVEVNAGRGIFWFDDLNPADPNPVKSIMRILPDQIWRLELSSGHQVIWLDRPGTGVHVIGIDTHDRPLISAIHDGRNILDPTAELLLSLDDAKQRSIYKGAIAASLSGGITDEHGVWFGSPQGIYLYSDADGLQKVSNQPGSPANGCF